MIVNTLTMAFCFEEFEEKKKTMPKQIRRKNFIQIRRKNFIFTIFSEENVENGLSVLCGQLFENPDSNKKAKELKIGFLTCQKMYDENCDTHYLPCLIQFTRKITQRECKNTLERTGLKNIVFKPEDGKNLDTMVTFKYHDDGYYHKRHDYGNFIAHVACCDIEKKLHGKNKERAIKRKSFDESETSKK